MDDGTPQGNKLIIIPLHTYPEYTDECCMILNSEWPRSETSRKHELSNSSDKLPCSLVLVKKSSTVKDEVVGHSRLGHVAGQPECCSVKSVIINKIYRGQGLGKCLMLETEKFAFSLGYRWCGLTTHDQQGFYKKLGYMECAPMCFLASGKSLTSQFLNKIETSISWNTENVTQNSEQGRKSNELNLSFESWPPLPPPPPPLPNITNGALTVTWMKKQLKY